MAAGSSAPELATVVIGVFCAQDDIGMFIYCLNGTNAEHTSVTTQSQYYSRNLHALDCALVMRVDTYLFGIIKVSLSKFTVLLCALFPKTKTRKSELSNILLSKVLCLFVIFFFVFRK